MFKENTFEADSEKISKKNTSVKKMLHPVELTMGNIKFLSFRSLSLSPPQLATSEDLQTDVLPLESRSRKCENPNIYFTSFFKSNVLKLKGQNVFKKK